MYTYDLNKACALHLQYNKVILNFLEKSKHHISNRKISMLYCFFVGGGWFFLLERYNLVVKEHLV